MDVLGSDITKIAAIYSTFAGVLAGFVFAVIGYLLGSRSKQSQEQKDALDRAMSWSIMAFVCLSVASFLFAVESGDDRWSTTGVPRIRPLLMHVIASGVLTTAILVLLVALACLFSIEVTSDEIARLLRTVVYLTGLMTLYFFDGAFGSIALAEHNAAADEWLQFMFLLTAIWLPVLAVGEVSGYLLRRALNGQKEAKPTMLARLVGSVPSITQIVLVVIVFASAGYFYYVGATDETIIRTWNISAYEGWGDVAQGMVLCLCVLNLPRYRTNKETIAAK
jgi:heme/copper-type cytochrome/quinol oxidase subunit 2